MKIDLPEVDWKAHGWSIPGQLKKIFEEAGEVAEAVVQADPVNTIREALDTMQTCKTLISMVLDECKMPINQLLLEHTEKLERKGYIDIDFTVEDDEQIPYVVSERTAKVEKVINAADRLAENLDKETRNGCRVITGYTMQALLTLEETLAEWEGEADAG